MGDCPFLNDRWNSDIPKLAESCSIGECLEKDYRLIFGGITFWSTFTPSTRIFLPVGQNSFVRATPTATRENGPIFTSKYHFLLPDGRFLRPKTLKSISAVSAHYPIWARNIAIHRL